MDLPRVFCKQNHIDGSPVPEIRHNTDRLKLQNFDSSSNFDAARSYLSFQQNMQPLSEEVASLVGKNYSPDQRIKILDIACGAGEPTTTLAKKFPHSQVYSKLEFHPLDYRSYVASR